jgi:hypothetical protein
MALDLLSSHQAPLTDLRLETLRLLPAMRLRVALDLLSSPLEPPDPALVELSASLLDSPTTPLEVRSAFPAVQAPSPVVLSTSHLPMPRVAHPLAPSLSSRAVLIMVSPGTSLLRPATLRVGPPVCLRLLPVLVPVLTVQASFLVTTSC